MAKRVTIVASQGGSYLSGLAPGMDDFINNKQESIVAAKAAAKARGSLN